MDGAPHGKGKIVYSDGGYYDGDWVNGVIEGEGEALYAREKADALEAELRPFVGGSIVAAMSKHDTNPANNPQPPKRYRA